MNYDNFVFYGSWRDTLEGFREEFGDDYAKEVLWNIMTCATAGDIETQKKSIIGFISGSVMPNIDAAKGRHKKAIADGQKGGRPQVSLEQDEVMKKKKELGTWKAVAKHFGVDEDTLRRVRKSWETSSATCDVKDRKTEKPKNLDIDIDIDKDIEKEIDNMEFNAAALNSEFDAVAPNSSNQPQEEKEEEYLKVTKAQLDAMGAKYTLVIGDMGYINDTGRRIIIVK